MPSSPWAEDVTASTSAARTISSRNDFISTLSLWNWNVAHSLRECFRPEHSRSECATLLLARQFVDQRPGVVDLAQRLDDALRVHRDGAGLLIGVQEVAHQRLDVAVKYET